MHMYRALLLFVVGLFLTITTASSALAWWGTFDYGWNNKFMSAEFWQSDNNPVCATTKVVLIWTGNQVLFLADTPPNKKFSWAQVYIHNVDCYGYRSDEIQLFADLTRKPADRKDMFTAEEFAQGGNLRIHMPMLDMYGAPHEVRINMTARGGVPYLYTYETDLYGYGVFYSFATLVASLKIDNHVILNDVLNTPSSGYIEASTYVER